MELIINQMKWLSYQHDQHKEELQIIFHLITFLNKVNNKCFQIIILIIMEHLILTVRDWMEVFIMGNGIALLGCKKGVERWFGQMGKFIRGSGKRESNGEGEGWYLQMEIFMKDNGQMIWCMDQVCIHIMMEDSIKDNLNVTINTEKVLKFGQMRLNTMVITNMVSFTGTVNSPGLIKINIKVNFKIMKNMDWVNLSIKTVKNM